MNRIVFLPIAAIAAAIALAACNNSNPLTVPTPGPTCSPPSGTQSALVYPASGSTGVSDSFGQVVIGSTAALPSSWDVVLATALSPFNNGLGGVHGGTFQAASPPFPSPSATPAFPNPVYQSSSFSGGAFPGEVVQVYLNNTATNCTPIGPIGSFTTQ